MSLVYLFRKLVFIQVLLGIVAFCMAEPGGNPGLMLVAGTVCALSWYVVEGPTGKPLPQWTINIAALAAVAWLGVDMYIQKGHVILAMGHFTMWLQVLQLYGKKSNREYGLILVLSLLQMVGASILSVSMVFGMLLGGYCVLSLFTILLFQFKTTSDEVMEANQAVAPKPKDASRPNPVVGRGHRWQFRLTASVIAAFSAAIALVIFILIPRTSRATEIGLPSPLVRAQTGFSSRVQLGGLPPGEGSREPVLHMKVSQTQPYFLLHGASLDTYNPKSQTWFRGNEVKAFDVSLPKADLIEFVNKVVTPNRIVLARPPANAKLHNAEITLRTGRHNFLFTLYPTVHIDSPNASTLTVNIDDQQVNTNEPPTGVLVYKLQNILNHDHKIQRERIPRYSLDMNVYARGWDVERELIRNYALQVLRAAYKDDQLDRNFHAINDPRDYDFARVLEDHLQTSFSYSTTHRPSGNGDPMVEFLTVDRQGHCELFASALAAMTRSLGMRARVVTGYRAGEYNSIGGYYIVREKNAHAWTEIDCGSRGWQVFDGTPPGDVQREHAVDSSIFASIRQIYEHLEFLWLDTFVTYDKETRDEMLDGIGDSLRKAATDRNSFFGSIAGWFADLPELWRRNRLSFVLMILIVCFIVLGVASLVRTILIRRRRLATLQLTRLPRGERKVLAKRLTFYLQMLDMLERHGLIRPAWQSPFKFATELETSQPNRFSPVVVLTEEFYEIRFGHRELDEARQAKIKSLLKQLEQTLLGRTQA